MVNIYRPETIAQAVDTLSVGEHTLFAGGTDLMVHNKARLGLIPGFKKDVVFVDGITEITQIENSTFGSGIRIGAAATLADIEKSALVPQILKDAIVKIAAPALRNRATLGGNICNASPAADSLPPLYLLDAKVILSSQIAQRQLPLAGFISGPGRTLLQQGEMLSYIVIPKCECEQTFYHKVGTRAANALTKLSIVGLAKVDGRLVTDFRVAFGAVGPTIVRCLDLEKKIIGQSLSAIQSDDFIQKIIELYSPLITPIDDQRSTAEYRHLASLNLLKRFLLSLQENKLQV